MIVSISQAGGRDSSQILLPGVGCKHMQQASKAMSFYNTFLMQLDEDDSDPRSCSSDHTLFFAAWLLRPPQQRGADKMACQRGRSAHLYADGERKDGSRTDFWVRTEQQLGE